MRRVAIALLALFVAALPPSADAARKLRPVKATSSELRLVVVTAPGCIYCRLFKRDVQPTYEQSAHATKAPLVYIDINDEAADKLKLISPVQIVPTVLLMEGDREISRISGYLGPANFFKVLKHMIAQR